MGAMHYVSRRGVDNFEASSAWVMLEQLLYDSGEVAVANSMVPARNKSSTANVMNGNNVIVVVVVMCCH
jgi:hypothetical protein